MPVVLKSRAKPRKIVPDLVRTSMDSVNAHRGERRLSKKGRPKARNHWFRVLTVTPQGFKDARAPRACRRAQVSTSSAVKDDFERVSCRCKVTQVPVRSRR